MHESSLAKTNPGCGCARSGRCSRPPSQAAPSSSGVTQTGEKAGPGLPCRKPKPLASSCGMRKRKDTSLTSKRSAMLPGSLGRHPLKDIGLTFDIVGTCDRGR